MKIAAPILTMSKNSVDIENLVGSAVGNWYYNRIIEFQHISYTEPKIKLMETSKTSDPFILLSKLF